MIQIQWLLPPQPLTSIHHHHHHHHRRSVVFFSHRRSPPPKHSSPVTFSNASRKYFGFRACNCVSSESISEESKEVVKVRQYPFHEIEPRWQKFWDANRTFRTPDDDEIDTSKPKFYVLDMFPYPSGAGLHVGHPLGYTATDILARFKRMQGFNVLHPMGWDAFGLPAEQYAIELKSLGFSFDWDREISTTEPDYYKWTQWIFLQLLKKGLAYQAEVPVNWCPALGTVLANEEVVDGVSERGGHPVIRKPMRQWMLKITAFADRLLEDLDDLDWPESIKEMQRNWIGKSEGAEVEFCVLSRDGQDTDKKIIVYTTRPDTIFGVTYLVLAPEHSLLLSVVSETQQNIVEEYKEVASRKSDLERTELQKEKSGVFSGCYARNPVNGEAIPIWVADYVLGSYGTGAIMAVPAHDTRDHEFALKYNIPIHWVVTSDERSDDFEKPYAGEGDVINSSSSTSGLNINGLRSKEAAAKVIEWVERTGNGNRKVNYKLRDWLFARQRYWGEPIPVVFLDDNGEIVPIPETELPLTLPELDDFTPTGTGDPPLSKAVSWVKTVESSSGKPSRRETNTMPQWAGSCWYYLRFMDPKNSTQLVDKKKEKYWSPVDVYVGGAEHAVQYMACKDQNGNFVSADSVDVLGEYKQERIPEEEVTKSGSSFVLKDNPSIRLIARAHKMSKSRGNVINPDDVVSEYGADSLRLYEMFMGPLRDSKTWNTSGIEGVYRFLGRSWRLIVGSPLSDGTYGNQTVAVDENPSLEQLKSLHRCIEKWEKLPKSIVEPFVLLLSPYAPHMAEELWFRLGHSTTLAYEPFPKANPAYLKDTTVTLPVQINGRTRGTIQVEVTCTEDDAFKLASLDEKLSKYLDGKTVKKRIYVSGKILNVILERESTKVVSR
ncbi:Aminoacyl-tRNA synthetase, class 1a, anticodon-binding [Cynara cardunculus var. scolymus]|uniref:leucine--tRNA ligase n=1 Tax=Cynara cardunculus var. scolymus TaxID=59895 RepID=A0A103XTS9_CYNCS|nr:Aminoacyl-tRNA synthetase, class 1a, anticodon-binding [Cynara cardunculus var. scolymus]